MICSVENISKAFDGRMVLDSVSLALCSGHNYVLCGDSGCGKTTLLRILCGLDTPDGGRIALPDNTRFSYAFQEPRLFEQLSVLQNIQLLDGKNDSAELLCMLDLTEAADALPSALSGGMKTRAALARALSVQADIYLLDEPTAGQDAAHAAQIVKTVRRFTNGALVLAASHDAQFIHSFADTVLFLKNGKVFSDFTADAQ